jgi:hypothetical protein
LFSIFSDEKQSEEDWPESLKISTINLLKKKLSVRVFLWQ